MLTKAGLWTVSAGLVLVGFAGVILVGCGADAHTTALETEPAESVQVTEAESPIATAGAQLWAQNCIRCHNIRTPTSLSDRQWQITMRHMRVRANLTAEEHESILTFLKAAN